MLLARSRFERDRWSLLRGRSKTSRSGICIAAERFSEIFSVWSNPRRRIAAPRAGMAMIASSSKLHAGGIVLAIRLAMIFPKRCSPRSLYVVISRAAPLENTVVHTHAEKGSSLLLSAFKATGLHSLHWMLPKGAPQRGHARKKSTKGSVRRQFSQRSSPGRSHIAHRVGHRVSETTSSMARPYSPTTS